MCRRAALSNAHALARLDPQTRYVLAKLTRKTPRQPDRDISWIQVDSAIWITLACASSLRTFDERFS
jgi:hypothetical protein